MFGSGEHWRRASRGLRLGTRSATHSGGASKRCATSLDWTGHSTALVVREVALSCSSAHQCALEAACRPFYGGLCDELFRVGSAVVIVCSYRHGLGTDYATTNEWRTRTEDSKSE